MGQFAGLRSGALAGLGSPLFTSIPLRPFGVLDPLCLSHSSLQSLASVEQEVVQGRREKSGLSLDPEPWPSIAMLCRTLRLVLGSHSHFSLYPLQMLCVHTQGSSRVCTLLSNLLSMNEKASLNTL